MRSQVAGRGFLTEPVDILTVTQERDERGDPEETIRSTRTHGRYAPTATAESIGALPFHEGEAAFYLAPCETITATSRLKIPAGRQAGLWEVVGVHDWGVGLEVRIRRVT